MDATAKKPFLPVTPRLSPRWVAAGEYLLMILVVFYAAVWCLYTPANCNTALRFGVPLLGALLVLRGDPISPRLWRRVGFVAACLGIYLVATRYNGIRFVLYYILPLLLLLLYTGSGEDGGVGLLHKLCDIMTVLTALSLFFYLFGTVLHWIPKTDLAAFYWGGGWRTCPSYFHLYYEAQQITFFGWDLPRNCGVFPEAPGFAVFLVAATAAEVLLRDRPRLWRCVLFAVATVTTVSVKAFLLMAAVFTLRYVLWPPSWLSRRVRMWLFPVLGVGMTLAASVLLWDKLTSVSGFMRLDDVAACLKAFSTAPIFGTGYWNDASIVPFFSYPDRYNNGLSMGAAVILAQGGLYLSTLYWWPAVGCVVRSRGHRRRWVAFSFIYAALLFSGNIVYHFLTLLFIAVLCAVGREDAP
ncbi:MAG: hypothetical protein IKL13_04680 [Clostridia bacterium]|nr:hypothetical protein [Clostridia bacterium]